MKSVKLALIAILISCPYKSAYGAGATNVTAVTLDIKKKQSTNDCEFYKTGDFRSYTAKDGREFSKIVSKNKDIWTGGGNDNAVKVVVNGARKKKKHIAILLKSGKFVLIHKQGNNLNDITSKRHDISRLKFYGENDAELKKTDYEVTIAFFPYRVTFNDRVKCRKIMFGDKEIWKSTEGDEFKEIKSLALGLISNEFSVINSKKETKKLDFNKSTTTGSTTPGATTPGSGATEGGQSGTGTATTATTARAGSGTTPGSGITTSGGHTGTGASQPATGASTTTPATGQG
ncbi:hypothetical protein TpMuguga_04g00096 [Theileria parva strain Muguga]|uniref:Uncharacterized protein n=1 Tax=Theileria parva TaxID=5875 RepID=Q4N391_THEPA|nr:uncharacterized protein TpMuguga_04g00096 [Theileria parva strain Muguga]EAN31448.1 hypothetical protein TpMuguga_04g00096 [Theileria parva strain Muguga]|eukprot:XP_763731.1 hypothetical protein [Theileria parva strain Muguga]